MRLHLLPYLSLFALFQRYLGLSKLLAKLPQVVL